MNDSTTPELPPFTNAQIDKLMKILSDTDVIHTLTDAELSNAVIKEVWGTLRFCSRKDWLLDEMITRFENKCGIVRNEDGEIVVVNPPEVVPVPPVNECVNTPV